MAIKKVALLTAGGLAPCLSSAVGALISQYSQIAPEVELIAYRNGYQGLLLGDTVSITPQIRAKADLLHNFGGSPIGNSRVKLTNVDDCVARGLVPPGSDPRQVAAAQLIADGVDVLHTIGGDDTNTAAADCQKQLTTIFIQLRNHLARGPQLMRERVTSATLFRSTHQTPVC
jgi:diphosphate-dependent phosphofructokinase